MSKKSFMLAALAVAAIVVPAASSANGKTMVPPFARAQPTPATHHGVNVVLTLDPEVTDGRDAAFTLGIRKTGGPIANFTVTAIGWSFDGQPSTMFVPKAGQMSLTKSGVTYPPRFVDIEKNWIRTGPLMAGVVVEIQGKVTVSDRQKVAGLNVVPNFFCIQAVLRSDSPGAPKATWYEVSNMACSQYSVP